MLYDASAWSGTADAWSKMAREFMSISAFFIDKNRFLRRISFGMRKLPIVEKPQKPEKKNKGVAPTPQEQAEYATRTTEFNIKTAALQAQAIEVIPC